MIKMVSGSSVPVGSTVALVSLCNLLNSNGYECALFGPDNWYMDKCKSGQLIDFHPEKGDIVIVHDTRLYSLSDVYNLNAIDRKCQNNSWHNILQRAISGCFNSSRKPDDFLLVLTCHGDGYSSVRQSNLHLFHKIHCLSGEQQLPRKSRLPVFVCPNPVDDLKKSDGKPANVAGVIGTIRKENKLELSIKRAFQDGMETVIIYGYLADPIYYYNDIRPLAEQFTGKIKFAGFVDDKQKLYDSVSDVYCSANKPWSMVKLESKLTNTHFHGLDSADEEPMTNDRILSIWIQALGLK